MSLINGCLEERKFPDHFKKTRVVPLHKGSDQSDFNNYRPISLLPISSRVFGKIIYIRIKEFMEKRNFFIKSQFGFRRGFSTEHAIQFLTTTINDALDDKLKIATIYLDILSRHLIPQTMRFR